MSGRIVGALVRAALVIVAIALPGLILPYENDDFSLLMTLVALFMGGLTFVEYVAVAPGLIEFRFAPLYNAMRFATLVLMLALTSFTVLAQIDAQAGTGAVRDLGARLGSVLDVPLSPLRSLLRILPASADPAQAELLRQGGALVLVSGVAMIGLLCALMRWTHWPGVGFNLWTNMPTFYSSDDSALARRLRRDALVSVVLALALPYLLPEIARQLSHFLATAAPWSTLSLIWTVVAWAFLPAGLFMRGMAILRAARQIERSCRETSEQDGVPA